MIQDAETASIVAKNLQESFRQLDESAATVRERCSEVELNTYLAAIGPILADLCFRAMNPLYRAHPELAPKSWEIEKLT